MVLVIASQARSIIDLAEGAFTAAVAANPAWLIGGLCAAGTSTVAMALLRQRTLRAALAATANWLLDGGCLWAGSHAVGLSIFPLALLTGYALAMAATGISPWPGGLGIVDIALAVSLTTAGAPTAVAVGAVLLYRLISIGSVIIGGWIAVATHHAHHRAGPLDSDTEPVQASAP